MNNKCEFYNQTFLENLHNFEFDLDKKNIRYTDPPKSIPLDLSRLENLLSKIPVQYTDIWTPYIIDQTNSDIVHSNLARSTIIKSDNLGIEEIIRFEPSFRDWNVTGVDMVVDWIITPIIAPFIPRYGVLFWYKNRNPKVGYALNEVPINSVIYPTQSFSYQKKIDNKIISVNITPDTKLIKKNNVTLLIVNQDKVVLNKDTVLPNFIPKYFDIQEYITFKNKDNPKTEASVKDFNFTFTRESTSSVLDKFLIHISDGEAYSYVDSQDTQTRDYSNFTASKTYLSPVLHENYRQIYHHLTLDYKKIIDIVEDDKGNKRRVPRPMFPHKQFRLFKKLCYFLATHPLLDRTTVSLLQSTAVKDIVNKLIETQVSNQNQEKDILNKALFDIGSIFKDLNIPESYYDKNNLPKKLLTKYGAKLRSIDDKTNITLSFKDSLEHGENVKCNWDVSALCDKNIKSTNIYYNSTIRIGALSVRSNIRENQSAIILRRVGVNGTNSIPLWDIKKRDLINNEALFSVGQDIEIDFNTLSSIPQNLNARANMSLLAEDKQNLSNYELSFNLNLDLSLENTILEGSEVSAEWSMVAGPDCLRFGNSNLTTIRDNGIFVTNSAGARFYTSEDISPDIYIKSPGKYTIQCRLSSNFGVFVDTINIHVVNKDNDMFEIYTRPARDTLRKTRILNLSQNNKNIIILPNIREFMIGKNVFWPTYSDVSVLVPRKLGGAFIDFIEPFGSPKNKFAFPGVADKTDETNNQQKISKTFFSISLEPKNCVIDISKIILSNIYGPKTPHCEPIYRCTVDNQLFDIAQESSISIKDPLNNREILVPSPTKISVNNLEIKLKDQEKIDQLKAVLFDNKEANLKFNTYTYNQDIYASRVGAKIEGRGAAPSDNIVAYENFPDPTDPDYENFMDSFVIPMKKTYFHPNSGLLTNEYIKQKDDYNNKTSIIIGDHSKRNCKTFRGLGFETLKNESTNVQIYSSQITLRMNDDTYDLVSKRGEQLTIKDFIEHDKNFKNPEFGNQNYGYRRVNQSFKSLYAYTDELEFFVAREPDGPTQSQDYCTDSVVLGFGATTPTRSISYSYPYPGPRYSPKFIEPLIYDRNFGRKIGDLEIKLNFLNYINPKELVIWLDIAPPGQVRSKINIPGRVEEEVEASEPYYFNNNSLIFRQRNVDLINNIPNSDIRLYLSSLFISNNNLYKLKEGVSEDKIPNTKGDIESFDTNYPILLLNQDHLDFSTYNNILKFTDNTNNLSNNRNASQLISTNVNNTVGKNINGQIELSPTKSAPGFSDYECYKYKAIIENNNLDISIGANFYKLDGMPMFAPFRAGDPGVPHNRDAISFTLNIAIVQESDDGSVYDRVTNTDNLLNINNIKTKNISNITTNSLCNWDLIISNSKEQLNFEDKDVLGQIDYNNSLPKYDGYNFYGKIPNNLVPPVNLNAPNNAFFNLNSCFYSRESLTAPRIPQAPVLNITPLIYIPSFTLGGELVSAGGLIDQLNNQSREIVGFFNDLRRQRQQQESNREIYIPRFENYVVGRSEKALISISKDKTNWYKLEAGILRYKNCPILKNKKHKYKKIHYLNELKDLAKFNIGIVNTIEDLIDIKNIKNININKNISFNDIQKKSFFDKIKKDILILERQINTLTSNNKEAPKALQEKFSDYKNFYYSVGPAGLEDDDILRVEINNPNDETTQVKFYTTQIKDKKIDNISLIDIGTKNLKKLLIHNKSIFIDNNILEIYDKLSDEEAEEEDQDNNSDNTTELGNLFIIDDPRPYFIYSKDSLLTFFEKKENVRDSEKSKINQIQKSIDTLNTELQDLLVKLKDNKNQPKSSLKNLFDEIKDKKQKIMIKEGELFHIEHIKNENTLLSKALIFKQGKLQTLFYLQNPIKDSLFLVITPEDNRIIIFDKDYYTKEHEEENLNKWIFANTNANRNEVTQSSGSVINLGSYGSGAKFNIQTYLYNSETPNIIKNFIDNIVINIKRGFDHTELCKLFEEEKEEEEEEQNKIYKLKNIFVEDIIDTKEPYSHYVAELNNNRDKYKILDSIMNTAKYNAYIKNIGIKYLLEANIDYQVQEEGEIQLNKNLIVDYVYKLVDKNKKSIDIEILKSRTKTILENIKKEQLLIETNNKKLSETSDPNEIKKIQQNINTSILSINVLRLEYNHLFYYIDKCKPDNNDRSEAKEKNDNETPMIPNIFAIVNVNEDKSISIMEESTDDYYIINIDAYQKCYPDNDKNTKIMKEIKYTIVGEPNRFLYGTDPFMFIGPVGGTLQNFSNDNFNYSSTSDTATYTFKENYINKLKLATNAKNNLSNEWILNNSSRTFYVNGGESRKGAIIRATYTYFQLIPKNDTEEPEANEVDGGSKGTVKYIFNLDKTDNIYIDFKKIPRNLRNVDNIFDRHVPNSDGFLTKSLIPSPGGPVDASLKTWKCISSTSGREVPLPDNFKWMNLMKYIAFYKNYLIEEYNLDINQNMQIVRCRDEMELIPYDYKAD
jgi:hypothetical protein